MTSPRPLGRLSTDELSVLDTYFESVRFPAGALIFEEGSAGDSCYLIDAGEVRLEVARPEVDSDGVLGFLEPGTILGELSLLDSQPRSASAYSHTDVTARRLSAEAIERLRTENPRVALQLYRTLARDAARKLRATTQRLADFAVTEPDPDVHEMVARARQAVGDFGSWSDERIDALLLRIAQAAAARAGELAAATVAETRIGNVADKTVKNQMASLGVYRSLAGRPGRGALQVFADRKVTELASPSGVIFALIPMTNPVATAVFKTLIALKGGNALILSFHRAALGVGNATGDLIRGVLADAGAPPDLVQWIKQRSSRKKTAMFLSHPGVSLVLATGGAGMVKAAYSSGTPAIGVGPANTPTLICGDADPDQVAHAVVLSKSFDNGLICGAEHNLIVVRALRERLIAAFERAGAAVLSPDETKRFLGTVIDPKTGGWRAQIIGQAADAIAGFMKITRDHPIKLLVVPADQPGPDNPLAGEKIFPVLSLFTVQDENEGTALAGSLLGFHGAGHTAVIHGHDPAVIERFALAMPAGRILVNSPSVQGVVGLTSGLEPSFVLGCGTFGGNSTTDNVGYRNLLNIKRLAYYVQPPDDA
jgi:acyl-CoA reductase-like NAD-dependent aldehyde dehydrogenase